MFKGYKNIIIPEELYNKLLEIQKSIKLKSLTETIKYLIDFYERYSKGNLNFSDNGYYTKCPYCDRIAHLVSEYDKRFFYCPYCNKTFWK